jgi:hypothetical protein
MWNGVGSVSRARPYEGGGLLCWSVFIQDATPLSLEQGVGFVWWTHSNEKRNREKTSLQKSQTSQTAHLLLQARMDLLENQRQ